jgi:hypothetical protein
MLFRISLVSEWKSEKPPSANAMRGIVHRGTRENGSENVTEGWVVDLNSLEDLLALAKEVGTSLVVSNDDFSMRGYTTHLDLPEITVYDDYME